MEPALEVSFPLPNLGQGNCQGHQLWSSCRPYLYPYPVNLKGKPLPSISPRSPVGSVLARQRTEHLRLGLAPQGPQLSWWLWNWAPPPHLCKASTHITTCTYSDPPLKAWGSGCSWEDWQGTDSTHQLFSPTTFPSLWWWVAVRTCVMYICIKNK